MHLKVGSELFGLSREACRGQGKADGSFAAAAVTTAGQHGRSPRAGEMQGSWEKQDFQPFRKRGRPRTRGGGGGDGGGTGGQRPPGSEWVKREKRTPGWDSPWGDPLRGAADPPPGEGEKGVRMVAGLRAGSWGRARGERQQGMAESGFLGFHSSPPRELVPPTSKPRRVGDSKLGLVARGR